VSRVKPLLASEALMDDLAPVEPGREASRKWCAALGAGAILMGSLPLLGLRDGGWPAAVPSYVLGLAVMTAALARIGYKRRALAMVAIGVLASALGFEGSGPAASLGDGDVLHGLLRLLAAATLPAALLFRARYRAFRGARWILLAGYVAALPFTINAIAELAQGGGLATSVGAGISLAALAAAFAGFMGSETTGAASYTAFGIIGALSLDRGIEVATSASLGDLLARWEPLGSATLAMAAFAGTASIIALGLYQVLATHLAATARRINLYQPPRDSIPGRLND
jgi:hypothetical protein